MDIQVNDVSKIYGTGENKVVALCHANMTIHSGDFISIMGPSGSGKSTLLHIISGLDTPTSGKVLYGDTGIHHGSDKELSAFRRQKIGFIFQQFNLLPVLTAQGQTDRISTEHKGRRRTQAAERKVIVFRGASVPGKDIEGTDAVEAEKCRFLVNRPFHGGDEIKISIGNDD